MRSLRTLMVAAGLAGIAPAFAAGQSQHDPDRLLKTFKPCLPSMVEYDTPAADAVKACKVAIREARRATSSM